MDMGTGFLKAGFSGEDLPRCVIPTAIAEKVIEVDPSQQTNIAGMEQKAKTNYTFGNGAIASRSTHDYHEPISRGVVIDFDRVTRLLEHVFTQELGLKTANMNLLMTDSPVNTKENKQKICEIMFEHFKVKSFSHEHCRVKFIFNWYHHWSCH